MSFSAQVDVIIGKPLLSPQSLGFDDGTVDKVIYTEERHLPKILSEIGFFKSNSEVRRNRPDLVVNLDKLDMQEIRVGKKILWVLVGLSEDDYNKYEQTY